MTFHDIGFPRALDLVRERIRPSAPVTIPLWEATGAVLAADAVALVDSPSVSASTRDGFALRAEEIVSASEAEPTRLTVIARANAGDADVPAVTPGTAVEVMTGAALPAGADAVVATEFCRRHGDEVEVLRVSETGRNVMARGVDVRAGATLAAAGTRLRPATTGLLAAGGLSRVSIHPRPKVAVVATGDEVVAPGVPLRRGQLYASNLVTLQSWLREFGMESCTAVIPDDDERLHEAFEDLLGTADAILTSGGAWKSQRDRTVDALESCGFEIVFHRVRLAPGKAVAFGLRDGAVAFCLPGGPPSNEMAFLQLALPGMLALSGRTASPFERTTATLRGPIRKQRSDPRWTNFFQARLHGDQGSLEAEPLNQGSRLECQARADALLLLPEGTISLDQGDVAEVLRLEPR